MEDMTVERWKDPGAPEKIELKLGGSLTIGQAASLREEILAAFGEASELRVDLSGVTEIDLTALQILGASHRSSLVRGKRFSVSDGGNMIYLDGVAGAGFRRNCGCSRDTNGTCIWVEGDK